MKFNALAIRLGSNRPPENGTGNKILKKKTTKIPDDFVHAKKRQILCKNAIHFLIYESSLISFLVYSKKKIPMPSHPKIYKVYKNLKNYGMLSKSFSLMSGIEKGENSGKIFPNTIYTILKIFYFPIKIYDKKSESFPDKKFIPVFFKLALVSKVDLLLLKKIAFQLKKNHLNSDIILVNYHERVIFFFKNIFCLSS